MANDIVNINGTPIRAFDNGDGTYSLSIVAGAAYVASASFTRPSDTTQYTAGDAATDSTSSPSVMTFSNCAKLAGGSGVIVRALMIDSANQTTKGSFELWLFHTAPTADNDNAAFSPTDAECATLVDIIPLSTTYVGDATAGADGNCVFRSDSIESAFNCASGSSSLFGILVVRNAYTPVSAESFTIKLEILRD